MALVSHNTSPLASRPSLHQDRMRYPRHYAGQGHTYHDPNPQPFVYTSPRLQSACGSPKARKVLGLVAQAERRSMEEEGRRRFEQEDRRSVEQDRAGPNKAQRTLGLVTDLPRDRRSWGNSRSRQYNATFEQKLAQTGREIRPFSRMHNLALDVTHEDDAAADREQSNDEEEDEDKEDEQHLEADDDDEEASPVNPEKTPYLGLPISQSPQQLSFPSNPIELDAGPDHELLLPPPRPRARPHSYTSPRFSERPKNKIASSRSRCLSFPPNFSRPLSSFTPKPVPGEDMERDPLSIRFNDIEDDPRSPMSPIGGTFVSNEIKAALEKLEMGISKSRAASPMPPPSPPPPAKRASKPRWSSLPVSLMKLAHKRKSSKNEGDGLGLHILERKQSKEVVTLTEENLQRWEDEVGYVPKMYRLGYDLLKTPVELDMEVERCTPVPPISKTSSPRLDALALARAQGQMLTPPMSLSPPVSPLLQHARQPSSNRSTIGALASPSLLSPTYTPTLSQASFAPSQNPSAAMRSSTTSVLLRRFPEPPACHTPAPPSCTSRTQPRPQPQPSLAQQKEALSITPPPSHLLTCVTCGEVEHPSAFPAQPLSSQCLHAGRVCSECVQCFVEHAVEMREGVKCPECGVGLGSEEVMRVVSVEVLRGIGRRYSGTLGEEGR
ncbi:hypothetical protein PMIN07_011540 [Paraphaeosphaeria minitans]